MKKSIRTFSLFMIMVMLFSNVPLLNLKVSAYPLNYSEKNNTDSDRSLINTSQWGPRTLAMVTTVTSGDALGMTDLEAVTADSDALADYNINIGSSYAYYVSTNLWLPALGGNGSTITWASSDETLVKQSDTDPTVGLVFRPSFATGDKDVMITATFTKGTVVTTREYWFKIIAFEPNSAELVEATGKWLTDGLVLYGNEANDVKTALKLPTEHKIIVTAPDWREHTIYISWESSNAGVAAPDGKVMRPAINQPDVPVTLTATISYGEADLAKTFNFTVTKVEKFPLALNYHDFSSISNKLQLNGNSSVSDTQDRGSNIVKALQFGKSDILPGGSAFTKNKVHLNDDLSFSTAFTYTMEHTDYLLGNAGLAFTIQGANNTVINPENPPIIPNLSFLLNTEYYKSGGSGSQATFYGLTETASILYNGDHDVSYENNRQRTVYNSGITNTNFINVWIEYDGAAKELEIRTSTDASRPKEPLTLLDNFDLATILKNGDDTLTIEDIQDVYIGFTGSTDIANEKKNVLNWYFKNDSEPIDFAAYVFDDLSDISLVADTLGGANRVITALVSGEYGPIVGAELNFYTSLGTLDTSTGITDSSGKATFTISSVISDIATVKAVAPGGAMAILDIPLSVSDADSVNFDYEWLSNALIKGENADINNVKNNLVLPVLGQSGCDISWISNKSDFITNDGIVTTPTTTQGNQTVTLTATIEKGTTNIQKAFNVIVLVSDIDIVTDDRDWLTEDLIKNQNSSLGNVTENLTLPLLGLRGSAISWKTSDPAVVSSGGVINRHSYTQGNQSAMLTATIKKGNVQETKTFHVIVKALPPTDIEALPLDMAWLTDEMILNGNSSFANITGNIMLPVEGPFGSKINWTSSKETYVTKDGTVKRPTYTLGAQNVVLTMVMTRGKESISKIYGLKLNPLDQTDAEVVAEDAIWLDASRTLGSEDNLSQYSVVGNLTLPTLGDQGSIIVWTSNLPEVIQILPGTSDNVVGFVTRSDKAFDNKTVTLTATLTKGLEKIVKSFTYTVLAMPDNISPTIVASTPAQGAMAVPFNTREITVTFSEDIMRYGKISTYSYDGSYYKLVFNGAEPRQMFARISKNKLIITFSENLPAGEIEISIPAGAVTDLSGNPLASETKLVFHVEEKLIQTIEIASVNPEDRQKEFPVTSDILIRYSYDELLQGSTFTKIILRERDMEEIELEKVLSDSNVIIRPLTGNLKPGAIYDLTIPAGAVTDRFGNDSSGRTIRFITAGENIRPVILSTYPADKQDAVDINQSIRINFSEKISMGNGRIELLDETGNKFSVTANLANSGTTVEIKPIQLLKPNTLYRIKVPYNLVKNSKNLTMDFDSEFVFKTGENSLSMSIIAPKSVNSKTGVPITANVEIVFPASVTSNENGITMTDNKGNLVAASLNIGSNVARLIPESNLNPGSEYQVNIPAGAFISESSQINDSLQFSFTTVSSLNMSSLGVSSFEVRPLSNWLVGKEMTFSGNNLQNAFKSNSRDIQSMIWNFGDGARAIGINVSHTYSTAGDYPVKLSIVDNCSITYEMTQTVKIGDYNSAELNLTVSPDYHQEFEQSEVYDQYNPGYSLYTLNVTYNNRYLPNEKINVKLYQNGKFIKNFSTITTGSGKNKYIDEWGWTHNDLGTGFFAFWYNQKDLLGRYELVFEIGSGTEVKTVRKPVTIQGKAGYSDLHIKLYDKDTGDYADYGAGLIFKLNGVEYFAEKKWVNDKDGYCYVIKNLKQDVYEMELVSSNNFTLHKSEVGWKVHYGWNPMIFEVESKKPSLRVRSMASDSNDRSNSVFIKGVAMPHTRFYFDGDWDGLQPGYYEIKNDISNYIQRTGDPWYDCYPNSLRIGEKMLVRMVSRGGVKSNWVDAKIEAVLPPKMNTDLNISYVNGEYHVDTPLDISDLAGAKINVLEGIPLLDGAMNFGVLGSNNQLSGKIIQKGPQRFIKLDIKTGGSYGKSKKKPKMLTVGYEMEAELYGSIYLMYNENTDDWQYYMSQLTLMGDLYKYWKKGFKVPVIDVGAEGILNIGAIAGGSLYIDKRESAKHEYSGIIYFEPYVVGSLYAGLKWVNVEGGLDGRIPAEVHIPTGYISADPSISAWITGEFIGYTDTLFSLNLGTHWDNGKDKVTAPVFYSLGSGLTSELDKGESKLTILPRNYLNRKSIWIADSSTMARFITFGAPEENPKIETRKENIYPYGDVVLDKKGSDIWLAWTDDNSARSAVNRADLNYSILTDGKWATPKSVNDDGTADYTPVTAHVDDGMLMAWQNINKEMTLSAGIGETIKNSEISVTEGPLTNVTTADIITLTNDDKFDHSPNLASDNNEAVLVWTKSEGLSFSMNSEMDKYKSPPNSDKLVYSKWNGISWSAPAEIQSKLPTVIESSLAFHDGKGLLLYTLDTDSDQSTSNDHEVYAKTYDSKTEKWGDPIRLTDNDTQDSNPKAEWLDGQWFITWNQDGKILHKTGLSGETKAKEFMDSLPGMYEIAVSGGDNQQLALVFPKNDNDGNRNLSAVFYDAEQNLWSEEIPLIQDEGFIRSFSPIFTADGKLKVAFTKAEIITEFLGATEYKKPGDKVDLCTLTYTPINDMALSSEDGISLSPETPLPGTSVMVSAVIKNQGDFAKAATFTLYDGNPADGMKIAEVTTSHPIPARSSSEIELEWIVAPEEKDEYDLYAVVSASDGSTDKDESNNSLRQAISAFDIAVIDAEWENTAYDDYLITATIQNSGSKTIERAQVQLKNNSKVVETKEISNIRPGQKGELSLLVSSQGLEKNADDSIPMVLSAVLPDTITEHKTSNNINEFAMEPAPILIQKTSVSEGETQASIKDIPKITFNMNVEKGDMFNSIVLEDEVFNRVNIESVINGDTLTIAPITGLDYNTRYILIVPKGAVGDSYDHEMEDSFNLSFETMSSNPEVIFTYPGGDMENVDTKTEIKVKYNQPVYQGITFNNIGLYGPQSTKVSAIVSLEGEWLHITPVQELAHSTGYSLTIPSGAVVNADNDTQQADFTIQFKSSEIPKEDPVDEKDNDTDDKDEKKDRTYGISRRVSENGQSTAYAKINALTIQQLEVDNEAMALLDLTDEVAQDEAVSIELGIDAIGQLIESQRGLTIITGKGDLRLPLEFLKSFAQNSEEPVTIHISENVEKKLDDGLVSTGVFDFSITQNGQSVKTFSPELTITLYLDQSMIKNVKRVIACTYNEETGSWDPVGGVVDRSGATITFTTEHFSEYGAFENIIRFDDVTKEWAKEKVEIMASRGLINGTKPNKFSPDDNITRAEFTAIIIRSLYGELSKNKGSFVDVPEGSWFSQAIETAFEMGIIAGVGKSHFDPNLSITREQLAAIAYRLYRHKGGAELTNQVNEDFADSQAVAPFAEEAVAFVAGSKIMMGNGINFDPKRTASRQEAAVVLYRLLEYLGEF